MIFMPVQHTYNFGENRAISEELVPKIIKIRECCSQRGRFIYSDLSSVFGLQNPQCPNITIFI